MRFSDLPLGSCFRKGRGTAAIKTSATTFSKIGGKDFAARPTMKVQIAPCNARPLIELGSTRRPS